jgi:hypothetical protein
MMNLKAKFQHDSDVSVLNFIGNNTVGDWYTAYEQQWGDDEKTFVVILRCSDEPSDYRAWTHIKPEGLNGFIKDYAQMIGG